MFECFLPRSIIHTTSEGWATSFLANNPNAIVTKNVAPFTMMDVPLTKTLLWLVFVIFSCVPMLVITMAFKLVVLANLSEAALIGTIIIAGAVTIYVTIIKFPAMRLECYFGKDLARNYSYRLIPRIIMPFIIASFNYIVHDASNRATHQSHPAFRIKFMDARTHPVTS